MGPGAHVLEQWCSYVVCFDALKGTGSLGGQDSEVVNTDSASSPAPSSELWAVAPHLPCSGLSAARAAPSPSLGCAAGQHLCLSFMRGERTSKT